MAPQNVELLDETVDADRQVVLREVVCPVIQENRVSRTAAKAQPEIPHRDRATVEKSRVECGLDYELHQGCRARPEPPLKLEPLPSRRGCEEPPQGFGLRLRDRVPLRKALHRVEKQPGGKAIQFLPQTVFGLVSADGHRVGRDHWARVQAVDDEVNRHTSLGLTVIELPEGGRLATVVGHLALVDVDRTQPRNGERGRLQDSCPEDDAQIGAKAAQLRLGRRAVEGVDDDVRYAAPRA